MFSEEIREGACPQGPTTPEVKLTPPPAQTMLGSQEKDDRFSRIGCGQPGWVKRYDFSNAPGRRWSVSRMRENLTYGLKWQGMETRIGAGY
jgi:hypothetical protein